MLTKVRMGRRIETGQLPLSPVCKYDEISVSLPSYEEAVQRKKTGCLLLSINNLFFVSSNSIQYQLVAASVTKRRNGKSANNDSICNQSSSR
jgi:hypothetical protein